VKGSLSLTAISRRFFAEEPLWNGSELIQRIGTENAFFVTAVDGESD
jgi:hypothetical protein